MSDLASIPGSSEQADSVLLQGCPLDVGNSHIRCFPVVLGAGDDEGKESAEPYNHYAGVTTTRGYEVSVAPSNTPVQSPSKLNPLVISSQISFTTLDTNGLYNLNGGSGSGSVNGGPNNSFESSFKNYSTFSNYTHQSHAVQQQFDSTSISNFENDILDVSFRNSGILESLKTVGKDPDNYTSVADTLLSFRNTSLRYLDDEKIDLDSNETIQLPFSSSPIPRLNLKYHEQRPVEDAFHYDKFPDFSDIPDEAEEHEVNEIYDDNQENKENNYQINLNPRKSTIINNNQKTSFNVTLKINPAKVSSINRLVPNPTIKTSTRTLLGLEIPDLSPQSIPCVTPRQSSIRFKEKSRINYNEDVDNQNIISTATARDQRRIMRDLKRRAIDELLSSPTSTDLTIYRKPIRKASTAQKPSHSRRRAPMISRSKNGCWTCRIRKKKCTEERPNCSQCEKLGLTCDGYSEKKPDFLANPCLQREKLNEIKSITSKRKKIAVRKDIPKEFN